MHQFPRLYDKPRLALDGRRSPVKRRHETVEIDKSSLSREDEALGVSPAEECMERRSQIAF